MTIFLLNCLFKDSISKEGHITGVRTSTQKFWGTIFSPWQMVTSAMSPYSRSASIDNFLFSPNRSASETVLTPSRTGETLKERSANLFPLMSLFFCLPRVWEWTTWLLGVLPTAESLWSQGGREMFWETLTDLDTLVSLLLWEVHKLWERVSTFSENIVYVEHFNKLILNSEFHVSFYTVDFTNHIQLLSPTTQHTRVLSSATQRPRWLLSCPQYLVCCYILTTIGGNRGECRNDCAHIAQTWK